MRSHPSSAFTTRKKSVSGRNLSVRTPALVISLFRRSATPKINPRAETLMLDVNGPQNSTFYRLRIKEGHNAAGLFVSASGKRCIPSTQLWLTVDSCAAYRFQHTAALRLQVRLGNIGIATVLEKIPE